MKIYIDTDDGFKCYTTDTGGLLEYEEPFFNNKCQEFIESYRCKPVGYEWVTENGEVIQAAQEADEQGQDEILTTVESALGVGM